MEVPDDELYTWIVGRVPAVEQFRTRVFNSIVAFHARSTTMTKAERFSPSDPLSGLFRGRASADARRRAGRA